MFIIYPLHYVSMETSIPSPCFLVNKFDNNDIGYFHQNIFSYFKGCEVPTAGWDVIYRNADGIQMPDGDIVHTIYVEIRINTIR